MGSPAASLLKIGEQLRSVPRKFLETATGEPFLHPLWQMLGRDPQGPYQFDPSATTGYDLSGMLPRVEEKLKEAIPQGVKNAFSKR